MQEISKDQMKITVKLKFNEGGDCESCFFFYVSKCPMGLCLDETRADKKDGNWIMDDWK